MVGNNVRLETELIIYLLITEINVSVLHIRSRDRKFTNGSDSEGNLIPMTTNKQTNNNVLMEYTPKAALPSMPSYFRVFFFYW